MWQEGHQWRGTVPQGRAGGEGPLAVPWWDAVAVLGLLQGWRPASRWDVGCQSPCVCHPGQAGGQSRGLSPPGTVTGDTRLRGGRGLSGLGGHRGKDRFRRNHTWPCPVSAVVCGQLEESPDPRVPEEQSQTRRN